MFDFVTVGEAATQLASGAGQKINPRRISQALYTGAVDTDRCPVVAGRRLIPRDMLPALGEAIATRAGRRRGVTSTR